MIHWTWLQDCKSTHLSSFLYFCIWTNLLLYSQRKKTWKFHPSDQSGQLCWVEVSTIQICNEQSEKSHLDFFIYPHTSEHHCNDIRGSRKSFRALKVRLSVLSYNNLSIFKRNDLLVHHFFLIEKKNRRPQNNNMKNCVPLNYRRILLPSLTSIV